MIETNLPSVKSTRATDIDYFDFYYQTQNNIDGARFDAVFSFFLSRTNNNKEAARSLAASLLEVTYSTGIDPMLLLEDFKKINQNESFKSALIGLFNSSRRNTSKIGFSRNTSASPLVLRNIRS
jgi:hypothetical protein